MKEGRDDAMAQLQESVKRREESLAKEQQRREQSEENQMKLQNDLLMATRRGEQLQSELEKLKVYLSYLLFSYFLSSFRSSFGLFLLLLF